MTSRMLPPWGRGSLQRQVYHVVKPTGLSVRKKLIEITDDEADEIENFVAATGEAESAVLKSVLLRGVRLARLERGLQDFRDHGSSSAGAAIAGLPRAEFLEKLMDRGIVLLDGPTVFTDDLRSLAEEIGSERLGRIATALEMDPTPNDRGTSGPGRAGDFVLGGGLPRRGGR